MTSTPRPLLIFPCNGNAVEALDCLGDAYRCIGFVDDSASQQGRERHGVRVYPRFMLRERAEAAVLAVPGSPTTYLGRRALIDGLGIAADRFARVIHPRASVSPLAQIGRNVLIMAGVVITSNVVIEDHVCVLPNTVLHHDALVGAGTLIGSNVTIAGGTVIGKTCYIGSGTSVMNGLRVGDGALVGIGSNVIRDVAEGTRVVGNPARALPAASAVGTGPTKRDAT